MINRLTPRVRWQILPALALIWICASLLFAPELYAHVRSKRTLPAPIMGQPLQRTVTSSQSVTETQPITNTKPPGLKLPDFSRTPPAEEDAPEADNSEIAPTPTAVPEEEAPDPATSALPVSEAIDNYRDARQAVIQIEAVIGRAVDPSEGTQTNIVGRGTGFIIDPSGIAVTNNHVVTGAAILKVFLEGEEKALSARLLGVSECADLAVIDIQGEGYPYLDWYDDEIDVGLDVYAAGFPLGDPEYTLTRGIVSKAQADGDTSWASIAKVLQHDARINPGNSGGPLIDPDGKVVGVNYRYNPNTDQNFAISRDEAIPIIDILRTGLNVDTIGVNGEAFVSEDGQISGVWVSSVASGSPADNAGITGGDIILEMEDLALSTDGTLATYCDVLRSHSPQDVVSVRVLRLDTQEVMTGQLNGRPLEQDFSFAEELNTESSTGDNSGAPAPGYAEYTTISNDEETLSLEVPTEWSDVGFGTWTRDDIDVGVQIRAAPDLDAFFDTWETPGVFFGASTDLVAELDAAALLDENDFSNSCEGGERQEFANGAYAGFYDLWTNCGDIGTTFINLAALDDLQSHMAFVQIQIVSEADLDALDHILDGFVVNFGGSVGTQPDNADSTPLSDVIDTSDLIYDYVFVANPAINTVLPAEWTDSESGDWIVDSGKIGVTFAAAPDLQAFNDGWETPGLQVYTSVDVQEQLTAGEMLDFFDLADSCVYSERVDHEHEVYGLTYIGAYDIWNECGTEESFMFIYAAMTEAGDQAVLIQFHALTEADGEAFGALISSFFVDPGGEILAALNTASPESESSTDEYVELRDDDGILLVRVPAAWSDIRNGPWDVDGDTIGVTLEASTDLEGLYENWTTPGLFLAASVPLAETLTNEEVLEAFDNSEGCTYDERLDYDDGVYTGIYDIWKECGGTDSIVVVLAAQPAAQDYTVLVNVQIPDSDGIAAFKEILGSFVVTDPSSLPGSTSTGGPDDNNAGVALATVRVSALNVRNGPGTNYSRIGSVQQGEELVVIGQVNNCAWLQVRIPGGEAGWVSGAAQYVTLDTACSDVPQADTPPAPRQAAPSQPAPRAATGQGCFTFQNNVGPELTVTFTRQGDNWNKTFKVPSDGQQRECFDPGRYTYTIDAPPPWDSINGELTVNAGDNFAFPVGQR